MLLVSEVSQDRLILDDARIVDPVSGELSDEVTITIADGRIAAIGSAGEGEAGRRISLRGLVVLPGLIDCHVHVTACTADEASLRSMSPAYVTAWAAQSLYQMLMRGFTTVRDATGADQGLAAAVSEGLFIGPRLLFCGPGLTQTGGHADHRGPSDHSPAANSAYPSHAIVCDGEAEVRLATREVLRSGADHVKMMLSGGVASPTDRVESTQFSMGEIRAAVEEADAADRYVLGHAYSARAVNRSLEAGVRSIEHGNLLDDSSIDLFLRHAAFLVPTLVTYRVLAEEGEQWGLPARSAAKVHDVLDSGLSSLQLADERGVQIAFGTDLLGGMQRRQSEEFAIRGEVQTPLAVLRAATVTGAKLLRLEDEIGQVKEGFVADLIAVRGNPLEDARVLAEPAENVQLVISRGAIVRSELT
jgi:imidazolonepropionase-like amidohydrolase